jgi:uncharacterized protein YbaP (TraB family)
MMKLKSLFSAAALVAVALLGPATLAQQAVPANLITTEPIVAEAKPALWKLADHDTTIYLFGTVHILPKGVNWYKGPVQYAFEHSDLLVTELPDISPVDFMKGLAKHGVLPPGQSLREKLGEERRGRYEGALAGLGQRAEMFDRNKPWVPATLIPLLTIQKAGYEPAYGVEMVLDAKAKARKIPREGLETIDFQFGLLGGQSEELQIEYLDLVVKGIPEMKDTIAQMVTLWSAGDDAGLAGMLNAEQEPEFAELMLYSRNRAWAKWIEGRMAQPGTVFIAVGAGHLGGAKSVGDLLAKGGFRLTRVQ